MRPVPSKLVNLASKVNKELHSSLDGLAWTGPPRRRALSRALSIQDPQDTEHTDHSTVKLKSKVLPPTEEERENLLSVRQTLFTKKDKVPLEYTSPFGSGADSSSESEDKKEKARRKAKLAEAAALRRVQTVQRLPRISHSVPTDRHLPFVQSPTPSLLEDFIPRSVGQVTQIIVDRVREVTSRAAAKSLNTFEKAFQRTTTGDEDENKEFTEDLPAERGRQCRRLSMAETRSPSSSRNTAVRISRPPTPPLQHHNMTTFPRDIRVKELVKFNGTPADLEGFDASVKRCLLAQNLPLYYGGWVCGEPDRDYEYVDPNTPNTKSNYQMDKCYGSGKRLTQNGDTSTQFRL